MTQLLQVLHFLQIVAICLASSGVALAGVARQHKLRATKQARQSESLSRDIRFGDSSVYGKYQYAGEGTAEVENEKTLDDLLGVRTHFKDRLQQEMKRH